ncbi:hypothetical protein ACJ73_05907 [Blastomyces percursus]|uniref:Uncharacterized protein n=1 Tax=Blastomyces percursus TaxID=1658174 RepID=A0A1J9Q292_9EURO|nr:hypothetical protein ACJ73_05907 [Blastomyces percursus]
MSSSPIGHAARVGYAKKFLSFTVTRHQAPATGEGREKPAGQGRKAGPGHRGMHVKATEREPKDLNGGSDKSALHYKKYTTEEGKERSMGPGEEGWEILQKMSVESTGRRPRWARVRVRFSWGRRGGPQAQKGTAGFRFRKGRFPPGRPSKADNIGNTVLHYLGSAGHDHLIKRFLFKRVNCSITNDAGLTLLILAVQDKHANVVKWLLQAGADVSTLYPNGNTIMLNLKDCLNARIVKLLISAGANISPCDSDGETFFVHAIRARKRAVARVLIEAGADVNFQLREGGVWILAVFQGDERMVQLLVEDGPDTNAR